MLDQKALDIKLMKWEEIPITVTRTVGTGGTVKAYRCGAFVKIAVTEAYSSSATSAGGNAFQATITGMPNVSGAGITFYGSCCAIIQFAGTMINARVIAAQLPANSKLSTTFIAT